MNKRVSLILISACLALLTACSDEPVEKNETQKTEETGKQSGGASLVLDQSSFTTENWKTDNSHQKAITGKLMFNQKPVVGAEVQVSQKRTTVTDDKGEFLIHVDANIVERDSIHVASLEHATLGGKPLDKKTIQSLLSLKEQVTVAYPIVVDKVEANAKDASLVDIYAVATVPANEQFPKFGVEKFKVGGTVKDADGKPVEGATVNLRRDGVEGFSMSDPSNTEGEFAMYYIPEDDENHYFYVHIPSKDLTYTLPEGKGFMFSDDYGVNIDIVLPKEGTVIDDKPPTLVATSAIGALYKGVLIGVHAKDYTITIPQRDGTFKVTMAKAEWEKNPTFYQVNYRGFHVDELELGGELNGEAIPQPEADEPSNLPATK